MSHLGKKTIDEVREEGNWQEMCNESSVAWFGGKTHVPLARYLPDDALEDNGFKNIDFLVIGWRKTDD